MTHTESIEKSLSDSRPHSEIVRKVYLTYPTMALIGEEEKQFDILNEISEYFSIPINNVHVAGSAKTGMSYHKKIEFIPKISDLDVAIIDSNLFQFYTEHVFKITNGFKNRTGFAVGRYSQYIDYVSRGIFRPDLMPNGSKRAEWFSFFGKLSSKHNDLFETINAGIYMSQIYFEFKQTSAIKEYINNKVV